MVPDEHAYTAPSTPPKAKREASTEATKTPAETVTKTEHPEATKPGADSKTAGQQEPVAAPPKTAESSDKKEAAPYR